MKQGLHPLVMIALVVAFTLFGRVLPTWTLSLATIAASNALIALGIVVLARTATFRLDKACSLPPAVMAWR